MKAIAPAGRVALAGGLLLAAAIAAVLLMPADRIIGAPGTDLCRQFLAWRAFAAANLRAGHLPLWNPYTYSGEPFLAGFQSALFYPPNLLFLCLPLGRAVNLLLVAHLFFLGWGMRRHATLCGLHPYAAGLCALTLPLSGAVFPHLYAGHLPNICTLAWSPWILAGFEDWMRHRRARGLLWAAAAVALQIMAGHVQYVFYTAIGLGLHTVIRGLGAPRDLRRGLPALAGIYAAGAALAAVQLFPGLAAAPEAFRGTKLSYPFVSEFALPPENLLTLLAPTFFGTLRPDFYWGRCLLWEMSAFAGVSSLALAAVASLDRPWRRAARSDLAAATLLLLLALGWHTPVFSVLYRYAPGFDHFRGLSKFTFPALIYLVLAAGRGADALIGRRLPVAALPAVVLATGAVTAAIGLFFRLHPTALQGPLLFVKRTGESFLPAGAFTDPAVVREAGIQAGRALLLAGSILALVGASLLLARRRPVLRWVPLFVLPLEMFGFARTNLATARYEDAAPKAVRDFIAARPGDYRVQNLPDRDNGYLIGAADVWGDDPGLLERYHQFMAASQVLDPQRTSGQIGFLNMAPLYAILRYRYLIGPAGGLGPRETELIAHPLARAQLVSNDLVLHGMEAIVTAMKKPGFDPARTVVLEQEPDPRPAGGAPAGRVEVVDDSADAFTVEAEAPKPELLLITDPYSRDWRARPVPGSAQDRYNILPADGVIRAIPLAAGRHRIRVEYVPAGLRSGAEVSALAWLLWLGALGAAALAPRGRKPPRDGG